MNIFQVVGTSAPFFTRGETKSMRRYENYAYINREMDVLPNLSLHAHIFMSPMANLSATARREQYLYARVAKLKKTSYKNKRRMQKSSASLTKNARRTR
jgi:hypothetical protein